MRIKKITLRSSNKPKTSIRKAGVILFLIFSVLIQIYNAISTLSLGAEIAKIEKEKKLLVEKNRELKSQLVEKSSLTKLNLAAGEKGYSPVQKTIYIETGSTSAQLLY